MIADFLGELGKFLIGFALLYTALTYLSRKFSDFGNIQSRWHHPFDSIQFTTQEFYALVIAELNKREIKGIGLSRKDFSEGGIFSSNREYLRIERDDRMFLVCAAPFGNGFFVSWWNGETMDFIKDLIPRIPGIGIPLARAFFSKSYYQMDTDSMFADTVKQAVNDAIDKLTDSKGVRPLTELERMPENVYSSYRRKA